MRFALGFVLLVYVGPLCLPAWFTWEEELARLTPYYPLIKALAVLLLLLVSYSWYQVNKRRKNKIFFGKKKDKKYRRLPNLNNDSGFVATVIAIVLFTLVLLVINYSTATGTVGMVSISNNVFNLGSGSGTKYTILWQLDKGYPLQVIGLQSNWYQVKGFEG